MLYFSWKCEMNQRKFHESLSRICENMAKIGKWHLKPFNGFEKIICFTYSNIIPFFRFNNLIIDMRILVA